MYIFGCEWAIHTYIDDVRASPSLNSTAFIHSFLFTYVFFLLTEPRRMYAEGGSDD